MNLGFQPNLFWLFRNKSTSGAGRKYPSSDLQWDHNNKDPNRLDLLHYKDHAKKTKFDNSKGNGGGFTRHGGKNPKRKYKRVKVGRTKF